MASTAWALPTQNHHPDFKLFSASFGDFWRSSFVKRKFHRRTSGNIVGSTNLLFPDLDIKISRIDHIASGANCGQNISLLLSVPTICGPSTGRSKQYRAPECSRPLHSHWAEHILAAFALLKFHRGRPAQKCPRILRLNFLSWAKISFVQSAT